MIPVEPMKNLITLLALGLALPFAAGTAHAGRGGGGYYGQPAYQSTLPGGFHNRGGRVIFGGSLGLGGMSDNGGDIQCGDCTYGTLAGEGSVHIGGFVGPRFALLAELQANVQTLSSNNATGDTTSLVQGALMIAGQFWLTPQLWIKGGVGFAELHTDRSYYGDGIIDQASVPQHGVAAMGAIGYELFSAPRFSVDIQGRLLNGSYKQLNNNVTAGSIGLGINWF